MLQSMPNGNFQNWGDDDVAASSPMLIVSLMILSLHDEKEQL